jgi:glycosyltransferase involved in cell wall biosynthesis
MKTLLLIPSVAKCGLEAAVEADAHPTMDYEALALALRSAPGGQADMLDYAAVDAAAEKEGLVRLVLKVAGYNAALALMGFQRRDRYDAIFTNAENVALPLALLFKTVAKRPRHVTIAHRISAQKKRVFYRWLRVHQQMDSIFVYSATQLDFARKELGISSSRLKLIHFHVDHRFYRPQIARVRDNQICAAGLEWRDYPTLIDAVSDHPELTVKLAAASPWSRGVNETEERSLPAHVDARRYDYHALRDLYSESSIVVVPLYDNDFQAGITTILEAMAMGKPVVVTRTMGQRDVIQDGSNGLYVTPSDPEEWKRVIQRLRRDPTLRNRLGQRARRWIEENATLDVWVEKVAGALSGETSSVETEVAHGARAVPSEVRTGPHLVWSARARALVERVERRRVVG